jgi:2-polyprenyl-3-methyl-5-hydroxy-6-metoxy-1,4-benzoquinol methylase
MANDHQDKKFAEFGNFSGYLEETECPICNSPPPPKFIFRKKEDIVIWQCPKCKVQYASPRFDEASLNSIYENEAFTDLSIFDNWSYDTWEKSRTRGYINSKAKTGLVKRYLTDGDKVLDVGCSIGEFVLVARKNGLDAEGIDNSKMLIDVGQNNFKIPVQQKDIRDYNPDYKFKGIVIWDVLEHLYDPIEMLNYCAALLEPEGYLFAQVPNFRGISNRLKSLICKTGISKSNFGHFGFPYHLYFFDKESLTELMDAAGFQAVHFESWSHLYKDDRHGFFNDIVISLTMKYCLSDYIVVIAKKKKGESSQISIGISR